MSPMTFTEKFLPPFFDIDLHLSGRVIAEINFLAADPIKAEVWRGAGVAGHIGTAQEDHLPDKHPLWALMREGNQ